MPLCDVDGTSDGTCTFDFAFQTGCPQPACSPIHQQIVVPLNGKRRARRRVILIMPPEGLLGPLLRLTC